MEIIIIALIVIAVAVVKIAKNTKTPNESPALMSDEAYEQAMVDEAKNKPSSWSVIDSKGEYLTSPALIPSDVYLLIVEEKDAPYVLVSSAEISNDKRKISKATFINKESQKICFGTTFIFPEPNKHQQFIFYGDSSKFSETERKRQGLIKFLEFIRDQDKVTLILEDNDSRAEGELYVHDHSGVLDRFDYLFAAKKIEDQKETRECPFCAEDILAKAIVCKHCGREVEPMAEKKIIPES